MVAAAKTSIFDRVVSRGLDDLSPDVARALLRMKFSRSELDRIQELNAGARAGALSDAQWAELEGYLQLGSLLTLMHSKARLAIKRPAAQQRRARS